MKKNPMAIAIAIVLVLFFALFGWMGYAHAAGLTGIVYTASIGKGYDNNWEVAACTLYIQRYPHVDSVFKFAMARNNVDTLSYFKVITPSQINPTHEPHAWARFTTTLGLRVPADVEKAVSMVTVDSARNSNASVVLDSASLAAIIAAINSGAAGLGDYPETLFVFDSAQSAVVMGARLLVFAPDTGSYQNSSGPQYTDIFGKAIYSLDSGTYPVAISSQGYFQAGAYSLIHVTAPGGRDTVFVYGLGTIVAPNPGLTSVIFTFIDGNGNAISGARCWYQLEIKAPSTDAYHMDSSTNIDASRIYDTVTNANGQFVAYVIPNDSILVRTNRIAQTRWRFFAENPNTGQPMLGVKGIALAVPARTWPLYYPDSSAAFGE